MSSKKFMGGGKVNQGPETYNKPAKGDPYHIKSLDEWMGTIKRGVDPARNKAFEELLLDLPGIKKLIDKVDELKIEVNEIKKIPPGTVINKTTLVPSYDQATREALKAVGDLKREVTNSINGIKGDVAGLNLRFEQVQDYYLSVKRTQKKQKGDIGNTELKSSLDVHVKELRDIAKRIEIIEKNIKKHTEDASRRIKVLEDNQNGFVDEVVSAIQEKFEQLDTAKMENQLREIFDDKLNVLENRLQQENLNTPTKEDLEVIIEALSELEEKFASFQKENKVMLDQLPESIREAVREEMKRKATVLIEKMFG